MSAPPCGILAITMAFDLGRIQNSLDSATDARSGLGEFEPDRLQDFQHVFGVDLSNDLIGQRRRMRLECRPPLLAVLRSEEHTSELQSLMRISYAVFCLKKKKNKINIMYIID